MLDLDHSCISNVRLQQLIRAEVQLNMLRGFIADHYEAGKPVFNDELETLYNLFIGKKEEE